MKDIKNAFALLEIFFKTLVRLFNALGLATDEEDRGGNSSPAFGIGIVNEILDECIDYVYE